MKQQTRNRKNRKNITKKNSGLKNPADDDIIQIGTNVLKNQQKGGTKTGIFTGNEDEIIRKEIIDMISKTDNRKLLLTYNFLLSLIHD